MALEDDRFRTDAELKEDAREQLSEKWGQSVLVFIVYTVITSAASGVAGVGQLLVGGAMELGFVTYFLSMKRSRTGQIEMLFGGFRNFEKVTVLYIVRTIYVLLWTLLLIVPGIVAALKYSMAIYILHDEPELTGTQALRRSEELMDGYKWRLLGLYVSFIGWAILCALTFGIGFLWLAPYVKATEANFYDDLRAENA